MTPLEIIRLKREGGSIPAPALRELVLAYTRDEVPDYQMSAFLMAAFLKGMTGDETETLVEAMLRSGEVLDLSAIPGAKVDKHSTGGVGDKISLILAPLVACLGVNVPMISGRGLGHSGGTLDKLESIPGFRTDLSIARMKEQLADLNVAMIGQTAEIAPADKRLYALRDVTATVEFIPFIAASIMSKKLAEGLDGLVLDVKVGNGAFMKTEEQAQELAEALANVGNSRGCQTVALMTSMEEPLGHAIGNWLEVAESVDVLRGAGPADVAELSCVLAGEMLAIGGKSPSPEEGAEEAREALRDGRAFSRFAALVTAQGGDAASLEACWEREGIAPVGDVTAPEDGYVTAIDAFQLGMAGVRMGAGRMRKEDAVDPFAGITLNKKVGDPVRAGETLARLHGSDPSRVTDQAREVGQAFTLGQERPTPQALVRGRYSDGGWSYV
ncbi:MAG: thymidine phosphorylase [Rhodothermales bacterium]|nr:thymidine phosphorylase [Rhodothermales bacterium]MBO6778509.1 thymidine phosphorylase [Rhodothermales bacterium]